MRAGRAKKKKKHEPGWIARAGHAGAQLSSEEAARGPLGPLSSWPAALRTVTASCLTAAHPMAILWGPELLLVENDAFHAIAGMQDGLTAQPLHDVSADLFRALADEARCVIDGGHGNTVSHVRLRAGDQSDVTLSLVPVFGEGGEVSGVLVDVLPSENHEARSPTPAFVDAAAELRTPLTLLLGPLEDMLADTAHALPGEQRNRAEVAWRGAVSLLRVLNSLFDLSRLQSGRKTALYEPTDLPALSREVAETFRPVIERAGLRLVVDCPALTEPVYVDRELWAKVVLQLLSNAFKHTFEGTITVRMRSLESGAVLEVEDTGVGIPSEDLPRVFDRFHRVRSSRARISEGSGLGLSVVQEVARLHQGTVVVSSTLGRGSTFTCQVPLGSAHLPAERIGLARPLELPIADALPWLQEAVSWLPRDATLPMEAHEPQDLINRMHRSLRPAQEPLPSMKGAPSARVLLVEDNGDMRQYIARLVRHHWAVDAVGSAEEALAVARVLPPDLLLTELVMPGMDGVELMRQLRADPRTATVPIILLSTRGVVPSRTEILESGADDYLTKPFSAPELLARINAHLKLAASRREATRRADFLAEASKAMSTSLDYEQTLKAVARLAVPLLADWCVVHVVGDTGELQQVATAHRNAEEARLLEEIDRRYPPDLNPAHGPVSVLQTGKPELFRELPDAQLAAHAKDAEHLSLLRRLGLQSGMWLPLHARGRTVGSLGLFFGESGRRHTSEDISLAEELARRAGIAVDNARLYREAQRAREELSAQLDFNRAVTGSLGEGLYAIDTSGRVTFANPAAERLLGYGYGELTGRHVHDVLHHSGRNHDHAPGDCPLVRGMPAYEQDDLFMRRDGRSLEVAFTSTPIVSEGRVVGTALIFRDMAERKRAEERLRRSERSLSDFFDNATVGLHWVGPDGVIIRANLAEMEMLGFTAEEYVGRCARDFHVDAEHWDELMARLRRGERISNVEARLRSKDGAIRHVLMDCSAEFEDGQMTRARCFTRDITERKLTEEHLKNSIREKDVLIKEVHHRVKNNLQVISSILNLQMGFVDEPRTNEMFKDIHNRVKSMALVHELLYQTKNFSRIDVEDYFRGLMAHLGRSYEAHSRGLSLQTDVDRIMLNPDTAIPCGLIVTELVSNALKHAYPDGKRGGEVLLGLKHAEGDASYTLIVSDNGAGLPAGFDVKRASTLGLSIVNALTDQLGGALTVASNGGTTFRLRFTEVPTKARI